MSRPGSFAGATAVAAVAASLCGCISRTPMTVSESFSNPHPPAATAPVKKKKAASGCALVVDHIADARSDPAILGSVAGRPVHSPANTGAWLQNVVQGFDSRDIDVSFDSNAAHEATPLVASLTLRTAWVSDLATSKTANTVWHLRLRRGDAQLVDADFRGADTAMNWSSGDGELQRLVDRAFGKALDLMAGEVRANCGR